MSLNMDAKIGITVGSTRLESGNDFADEVIVVVNKVAASSSHVCKTFTKSRICTYSNTKSAVPVRKTAPVSQTSPSPDTKIWC